MAKKVFVSENDKSLAQKQQVSRNAKHLELQALPHKLPPDDFLRPKQTRHLGFKKLRAAQNDRLAPGVAPNQVLALYLLVSNCHIDLCAVDEGEH